MVAHFRSRGGLLGAAVLLLSAGCRLNTMPPGGLAEQKNLTVIGSELRIRVRALAGPYASQIEATADDVARRCPDLGTRARAIEWKLAAVPQAQNALLQPDPLVALLDGWTYAVQMQRYLESPAGHAAFGDCAAGAAAAVGALARRGKEIAEELAPGRGDAAAGLVEKWADEHPLSALYLTRSSVAPVLASASARQQLGALQAVGTIVETLDDLTARIAVYRESLVKEARWAAELEATRAAGSDLAAQAARDAARLTRAGEQLGELAAAIPDIIARERAAALDALRAERVAVLAEIDTQRSETLALLQSERAVVLDRVDGMSRAAIDQAGARADQVIDHVFLRIAELGVALLVASGVVVLVVTRALASRSRRRVARAT